MRHLYILFLATFILHVSLLSQVAMAQKNIGLNGSDQTGNIVCGGGNEAEYATPIVSQTSTKLTAMGHTVRIFYGISGTPTAVNTWNVQNGGAHAFVSMHTNATVGGCNGKTSGTLTVINKDHKASDIELASKVRAGLVGCLALPDLGNIVWINYSVNPPAPGNLGVLNGVIAPCCLEEALFHDNPSDVAILKSSEGQDKIANGVASGIDIYLGGKGTPCNNIVTPTLDCDHAITLTCGVAFNGPYSSAVSKVGAYGCNNWTETGPERIHKITTTVPGDIVATITNFTGDLDVYILGSCDPSDCRGTVSSSSAVYSNAPAGTYYIVVDADDGSGSEYSLRVNSLPANAGVISGPASVCPGQNSVIYSVPEISGASYYLWTLPSGVNGSSTTNSITVNISSSASSGDITVKGSNSCGNGTVSSLAVTVSQIPGGAGTISGTTAICQGQKSVTYTVPPIVNTTSYLWTLPTGASGTSQTNIITVDYGSSAVSGNIMVKGMNAGCEGAASSLAITVTPKPATPIISKNGNVLSSDAVNGNQWYNENGIINGATGQTYTASRYGNYYVMVTQNGCSSTSNVVNYTPTGIEKLQLNKTVKVYPNPVSERMTIEVADNNEQIDFGIYNSSGQLVFEGKVQDKIVVPTDHFTPGIYFVKMGKNNAYQTVKVVKQ